MERGNRKESVAAFHRERILCAAEALFTAQGFEQTTISEIADASGYSRRTVYAYYDSKEEMRRGVVEKALIALEEEMAGAGEQDGFLAQYRGFCQAAVRFHREFPFAAQCLRMADSGALAASPSPTVQRILRRGEALQERWIRWLKEGQRSGCVRRDVIPALSVPLLWTGLDALLVLADSKGDYLTNALGLPASELLDYGFRQLIRAILAHPDAEEEKVCCRT